MPCFIPAPDKYCCDGKHSIALLHAVGHACCHDRVGISGIRPQYVQAVISGIQDRGPVTTGAILLFWSHHILYTLQHSSDGKESRAGMKRLAAHLEKHCSRRNGCAGIRDVLLGAVRCRARVQAQVVESSANGPDPGDAR